MWDFDGTRFLLIYSFHMRFQYFEHSKKQFAKRNSLRHTTDFTVHDFRFLLVLREQMLSLICSVFSVRVHKYIVLFM